jgi:MFS family permease
MKKGNRFLFILLLILSGEAIFLLPFVLPRIFRPTVLTAFELNNVKLGTCFSVYGLVALTAYFFGGIVADKVKPRILMGTALILTSFGGLVMASFPSYTILKIIYGYWGVTTILLFWAAMIKATRVWGGEKNQAAAFGLLDGGRGLVSALVGLVGVLLFAASIEGIDIESSRSSLRTVILFSSGFVAFIGLMVLIGLKTPTVTKKTKQELINRINLIQVIKMPQVWMLMLVVLCAYCGYKVTDDFSLYAKEVMGYSDAESATFGTTLLFIRPITGVIVGLLANRSQPVKWMLYGFLLIIIGSGILASGIIDHGEIIVFIIATACTALGVYTVRVLYFSLLKEGRIPLIYTGTAVGLISLIGFTPDIFMGPLMGYFLDTFSGGNGHRFVFGFMGLFALLGILFTLLFNLTANRGHAESLTDS